MPSVYIKANQEIDVKWSENGRLSDWESKAAEKICEKYGHPKCTIDLHIQDPEDPISPIPIYIRESDAISGGIKVIRVEDRHYKFIIDGIFKASIHKSGVPFVDAGAVPSLVSVTRFRESFPFEEPAPVSWEISSKKIK